MLSVEQKPHSQGVWRTADDSWQSDLSALSSQNPIERADQQNLESKLFSPVSQLQDNGVVEEILGVPLRGASSRQDQDSGGDKEFVETSGVIEVINQRYPDGQVQVKRHVMFTIEGDYVNHGSWQWFNRQGQVLAEGIFDQGQANGVWQRWHSGNDGGLFATANFREFARPFLSQVTFNHGTLDGTWEITDQFRRKVMELSYRGGVRHGTFTWYRANGTKSREMNFKDGLPHGTLQEWDNQNQLTKSDVYIEGRRVVREVTYWRANQPKTEDYFLDPVLALDGQDDWWTANFATYVSKGERVRHGKTEAWYENGQPKMRVNYREGLEDGRYFYWHPNGNRKITGVFENGLKQGRWLWWHENGRKAAEVSFVDGVVVGEIKRWNPDGSGELESIDAFESNSELEREELRPPIRDVPRFDSNQSSDSNPIQFEDFFRGS